MRADEFFEAAEVAQAQDSPFWRQNMALDVRELQPGEVEAEYSRWLHEEKKSECHRQYSTEYKDSNLDGIPCPLCGGVKRRQAHHCWACELERREARKLEKIGV